MDSFDVGIAIVGSGFAGLGMAIRLKQAGIDDFVVLERGRRRRRHLARQHLPGLRLRRPVAPLLVLLRPQPRLDRDLLAPARDPRLPAPLRRRLRRPPARPLRPRGHRRRAGTRRAGAGRSRRRPGELRAPSRSSPASAPLTEPKRPRPPGLDGFEGDDVPLRALGPRLRPQRQAGRRRSAPAPRRSSSCPRSSREVEQLTSSSARRRGSCPAATAPITRCGARGCTARFPPLQKLVRAGDLLRRASCSCSASSRTRGCMKVAERLARRHLRRAGRRPDAAREADARLHDRLQADPALQRLLPRARAAERRAA